MGRWRPFRCAWRLAVAGYSQVDVWQVARSVGPSNNLKLSMGGLDPPIQGRGARYLLPWMAGSEVGHGDEREFSHHYSSKTALRRQPDQPVRVAPGDFAENRRRGRARQQCQG